VDCAVKESPYGDGRAAERIVDLMLAQGGSWPQKQTVPSTRKAEASSGRPHADASAGRHRIA
jgi:hypothetical protein